MLRHGLAAYTKWFDYLSHLDQIDWSMMYQRYWSDHPDDMDRQRREQAEYLVLHELCHLHHHNHSPAFHQRLRRAAPNYHNHEHWLRAHGDDYRL